ncbi:hypothetical protein H072_8078 [Dactylellina haptotyla CBS 200.50]|uniref:Uncharacterized protein n=1 Tax=Dactylellina haptotyla (strain CBS 200.50) TaxID=1284197 RepID=S8BSH0_DACHA|nr:hypothetical protein H072_8078 [Dactylellina haptotyla CBS 200.50]
MNDINPPSDDVPKVVIPGNYQLNEVDFGAGSTSYKDVVKPVDGETPPAPPLGVLEHFKGVYAGRGLNQIFRPNGNTISATTFKVPLNPPPAGGFSNNVLELNLTRETLRFMPELGSVPNRGLANQGDIFLNGVPYIQNIDNVANMDTGLADLEKPVGIHFEPGIWIAVPETVNPAVGATLSRMASIPHGTTINAQGLAPTTVTKVVTEAHTELEIPILDITPFVIGDPTARRRFASQDVDNEATARLPQDLTKFANNHTIDKEILADPNEVLRRATKDQKITEFIKFTVSTAETGVLTTSSTDPLGGGTDNIAFLLGASGNPNAHAAKMEATFWIETVECELELPEICAGESVDIPAPGESYIFEGRIVPSFRVAPPYGVAEGQKITVSFKQIQYSQNVNLDFARLTWPHVSVATLVPTEPIVVGPEAFDS